MTALHNHWQVFDTSEPVLAWQALLPTPSPTETAAITAAILAALTPLVARSSADAQAEPTTTHTSTVSVRDDRGALVDVVANDAGQLLRRLEGKGLDPAYARRFAAVGLPFVTVSTSAVDTGLLVTVSFFSTLWFDDRDPVLRDKNVERLLAARTALTAVVRRHGGQLQAPTAPAR